MAPFRHKEPPRPKPLPIEGMLRNKSGGGLAALLPPARSSSRLSRSTLHKVFAGMLCSVLVLYCSLMLLIIQNNEKSMMGNWGPTGHSMATSENVLRNHIQDIAELKRKELEEVKLRQVSELESAEAKKMMGGPLGQGGVLSFEKFGNLEETDIHDMKPPNAFMRMKADQTSKERQPLTAPSAQSKNATKSRETTQSLRNISNASKLDPH